VPEQVALTLTEQAWRRKRIPIPPGAVRFAMHPCVLSNQRLREAGWAPTRTNRELLREFAATHHPYVSVAAFRFRRRSLYASAAATAALTAVGALAAGLGVRRRVLGGRRGP
jgi:hypothetical protein